MPDKLCRGCDRLIPRSEFWHRSDRPALRARCKECCAAQTRKNDADRLASDPEGERAKWRDQAYRSRYGLTAEQRAALLQKPCAVCGGASTVIDHDHRTGAVRAATCNHCNLGIGHFRDSPALLRAAIEYLERWVV